MQVDSALDSYQAAVQGSCWKMGNFDSVRFVGRQVTAFEMLAIKRIACHMLHLAAVTPAAHFCRVFLNEFQKWLPRATEEQLLRCGM